MRNGISGVVLAAAFVAGSLFAGVSVRADDESSSANDDATEAVVADDAGAYDNADSADDADVTDSAAVADDDGATSATDDNADADDGDVAEPSAND